MRRLLISLIVLLAILLAPDVSAAAITAIAEGDPPLVTGIVPAGTTGSITNGDFTITQTTKPGSLQVTIGDALNETTTWTFDFTGDPDYASFSASKPLASAWLTMHMTYTEWVTDDWVVPGSLSAVSIPEIRQDLPDAPWPERLDAIVQFDMLNYFTSSAILGEYSSGLLAMTYADDAIISYAQLDLTSVPVPGSFLLALSGVLTLVGIRRNKKNRLPMS